MADNISKDLEVFEVGVSLPWERQPKETWACFAAFQIYRDLPDLDRTHANVVKKSGRTLSLIKTWARKFRWDQRIALMADYEDKKRFLELRNERIKMQKDQVRYAVAMQSLGFDAITKHILPENLSPSDAVKLLEVGVKIQRLALGESTDNQTVDHKGTVQHNIVTDQIVKKIVGNEQLSRQAADLLDGATGITEYEDNATTDGEDDSSRVCDLLLEGPMEACEALEPPEPETP